MYDMAQDFRNLIDQLPLELLEEMKNNFAARSNDGEAIRKSMNDLDAEIYMRCTDGGAVMNELKITEYKNIRVLTTQQIAEVYGTEGKIISKNFERNKERYSEGKHYICLTGEELREFKANRQNDDTLKFTSVLYLWTEKGAFLHAKSLNTDTAWEVYDRLVDNYFKKQELLEGLSPELRAIFSHDKKIQIMEHRVDNLENIMNIDYAQQKQLKNFANEVVVNALGGKDAGAYRYRGEDGSKISSRCFSRFWHDFNDYFNINAYANLPRVKFDEALQYINRWQPPTNMQLEIGKINREIA